MAKEGNKHPRNEKLQYQQIATKQIIPEHTQADQRAQKNHSLRSGLIGGP